MSETGTHEVERWWPHLSIEAKHRLLADLEADLDAETIAEIEALCGERPDARLTVVEIGFIRTQMEAVD